MPLSITAGDLDLFRLRGDDTLDPLVRSVASGPGVAAQMLGALFRTDVIPSDDPRFQALLAGLPDSPPEPPPLVQRGQQLFQLFGPEILLILGAYALPAAYAASDGVQVIHRARRLNDDPKRRLCETAQMVINVMQPGSLGPAGIGVRSAIKVRLMHALVRHHVQTLTTPRPWAPELGTAINQEDLAGTLLTFSLLVLDGLRKIGAELSSEDEAGYLAAWKHIGALLGIDPRLRSESIESARELAILIGRRQIRPSPEGTQLARQLVAAVNALFPVPGYGTSLMHFFLDDSAFGVDLAQTLGLPPANWTMALVRGRAAQKRFFLRWLNKVPGARGRRRFLARIAAQRLILLQRPDKQTPFEIPDDLLRRWKLKRAAPVSSR